MRFSVLRYYLILLVLSVSIVSGSENLEENLKSYWADVTFKYTEIAGIGHEKGICRRDPSDIIKLQDKYYVFYTKLNSNSPVYPEGYYGTICYAVSDDEGYSWEERGEAVGRGMEGKFDSFGVFTPNIVKGYDNQLYLYYTGVGGSFDNKQNDYSSHNRTAIGAARLILHENGYISVAEKLNDGNPILLPSAAETRGFDSFRVDDAALVPRDNKYWLYYKGRAHKGTPRQTKMGLAVSEKPHGPFCKQNDNKSVQDEGHEVLVWGEDNGVVSLVTNVGRGVYYASDGIKFTKVVSQLNGRLRAPGAFRTEITDPQNTGPIRWGIHMGSHGPDPYLERFELINPSLDKDNRPLTIIPVPSREDRAAAAGWSNGGNWLDQHEDINRIGREMPDIELVFLGNSITQSIGGQGRRVGAPAAQIWEEFFGRWKYANFGISGDRTQHILWRILNGNFDNIKPRVIVLMIGTNNLSHGSAENITLGIKEILNVLRQKSPQSKILLMSIIRGSSAEDPIRQKAERINSIIQKLDKRKNIQYIDLAPIFYNQDGQAKEEFMRKDFVHFSLKGYQTWAEALHPYLQNLFNYKSKN